MKLFTTIPCVLVLNTAFANSAPFLSERATTLWVPKAGLSWNYLIGDGAISVAQATASKASVVDIDLFENTAKSIAAIKAKNVKVICYFSGGTHEPGRPDNSLFKAAEIGAVVDGWPEEKWLDIRSTNVQTIMKARVQLAADKGCDGIEPDNVDGYVISIL
jgi:hypothetical protein